MQKVVDTTIESGVVSRCTHRGTQGGYKMKKSVEEMRRLYKENRKAAQAEMASYIWNGEFDSDIEIDTYWGSVIEEDYGWYKHN